jgi:hypothetical protein
MFELQCSRDNKKVPLGDDYGFGFRQMYFFLKMCSTVRDINTIIGSLSGDKDYMIFMEKQDVSFKKHMDELRINLKSSLELIKDVRDNIGAHLQQSSVETALQNMNHDRSGLFQISNPPIPKKTHYKFTGELMLCILIRDTPEELQAEKIEALVEALIKSLQTFFHRFDWLFLRYALDRKLL